MLRKSLKIQVVAVLALVICAGSVQAQNITTMAGGGNPTGVATAVPVGQPWGIVQDTSVPPNTYIADNHSNRIYKVDSSGNLTVIAGDSADGLQVSSTPLTAVDTSLSFPQALAYLNGALYIADDGNNQIRVVNTNPTGGAAIVLFPGAGASSITIQPGQIADVAGLPAGGACIVALNPTCFDGSFATSAALNQPAGVVVDSLGNIFIADTFDNGIREVNYNTGIITNVAGVYCNPTSTTTCTGGGDGGAATSATFNNPTGLALDSADNVYVADTNDHAIRVVNTSGSTLSLFGGALMVSAGKIATVAGTFGTACAPPGGTPCGDTGASTSATLNFPDAVLLDSSSNIYIADTSDQVVRMVSGSSGTITPFAGTYPSPGLSPCSPVSSATNCGDGHLASSALLNTPVSLFLDGSGDLFIADEFDAAVREVAQATGDISTFAGIQFNRGLYGDGGPATDAEIQNPVGVSADSAGNVYIADTPSDVIRKVDTTGTISTIAGNLLSCVLSSLPSCGDGGPATQANLWLPSDVFADSAGNLYIADTDDNAIRKVTAQTGFMSTVAGTDTGSNAFQAGYSGDSGPATSAQLNAPSGVFVDSHGNIFIADTGNNVIREVTISNGNIMTVAGNGTAGYMGDTGPAISAELNHPAGVSVDAAGNIYIVDGGTSAGGNNVIRMVNTAGNISTVAGNNSMGAGYSGDGGTATSAQLSDPWAAFVDFLGNLFIADTQNDVVRVVNLSSNSNTVGGVSIAAGDINTVVGTAQNGGFSGDGGAALLAQLHQPLGMRSDLAGNLYIADRLNWRVRKIAGIVATTPTANLSTGSLTFASQAVDSSSSPQQVTITNNANLSTLQFTTSITGTNAGDFQESDSCSGTVASNGKTCTLDVTFKPTAAGSRSATMTITDSAAGIAENVTLSGTAAQATTTTTLKSSLNPSDAGQSVTFTATVAPSTSGTPTGTVTFKDGTTTLGSAVNLSSGVATLAISTLSAATHSITAVYSGDTNYSGSTSAALSQVVNAQSFKVAAASLSPSATVSAGGSATSTITITSVNGFSSAVTLTCSVTTSITPAPTEPATCKVTSPVTPAANKTATSTLTVNTTAATAALSRPAIQRRSTNFYAMWLLLPAMLLSTVPLSTQRRRKMLSCLLVVLAIAGCIFLVACGGGSSNSTGTGGNGGTASGAYTITVTGAATGFTSQTATVTLTVQ